VANSGSYDVSILINLSDVVGTHERIHDAPVARFSLLPTFPNPFNQGTIARFHLPTTGRTKLIIYNLLGQEVTTLVNGQLKRGIHEIAWDGLDSRGHNAPSGTYLLRLRQNEHESTKRIVLIE
jgi:hypothetical protein